MQRVPDIKNVARFGDGLVDGETVGGVAAGVVEHVEVRRRSKKCFTGCLKPNVFFFFLFNDDPLRISGKWVGLELKHSLGQPAGDGGAHTSRCGGAAGKCKE